MFFNDDPDERAESEDEPSEDGSFVADHDWWLAGVIARHAEAAGLIAKSDDLSWEWHCLFDGPFAEATENTPDGPEASSSSAPGAPDGIGGDQGAGLGGDFGGGDFGGF